MPEPNAADFQCRGMIVCLMFRLPAALTIRHIEPQDLNHRIRFDLVVGRKQRCKLFRE